MNHESTYLIHAYNTQGAQRGYYIKQARKVHHKHKSQFGVGLTVLLTVLNTLNIISLVTWSAVLLVMYFYLIYTEALLILDESAMVSRMLKLGIQFEGDY